MHYLLHQHHILKFISPYTMMMSLNLEPFMEFFFVDYFGEKEYMDIQFYVGAGIIFLGVVGNILYKYKKKYLKNLILY